VGTGTTCEFKNIDEKLDVTIRFYLKGTDTELFSKTYTIDVKKETVDAEDANIAIKNNGKAEKTVDLKSTVTFTADVENMPDGSKIQWYINGEAVKGENGKTFKVEKAEKDFTVQAKLVDAQGKEICESETQTVKVKTGFFAIIIAFFRQIFGRLPDVKWEEVK
jgi:hypothetical protein